MAGSISRLLDLPVTLLPELLSWSIDAASVNALLGSCRALHALRRDPCAIALLLLRRHVRCSGEGPGSRREGSDYGTVLFSCIRGSTVCASAVVRQVLQLLAAPTASHSRPETAPPALLQVLLLGTAFAGDATGVRELMALPQPPDVTYNGSLALEMALEYGHVDVVRVLLELGAFTPDRLQAGLHLRWGARSHAHAEALPLLLACCLEHQLVPQLNAALTSAAAALDVDVVARLLEAGVDAGAPQEALAGLLREEPGAVQGVPAGLLHAEPDPAHRWLASLLLVTPYMARTEATPDKQAAIVLLIQNALLRAGKLAQA